jgi:hypothetical protein
MATKALNLHSYIPPLSCHPPSTLKSMVFGVVFQILHLTTHPAQQEKQIAEYSNRFIIQGYPAQALTPLFKATYIRFLSKPFFHSTQPRNAKDKQHLKLLHLPFNPGDPSSKAIHAVFTEVFPDGHPLTAHDSTIMALPQLTICYHHQKTLGSILNPSDITNTSGITP